MDDVWGSKEVIHQSWLAKGLGVGLGLLCWGFKSFRKRFLRKEPALFKFGQWHFNEDNIPGHNPILVTDYLTKMGIKTVPHPPYSPYLAPCDFWLFPKPRGCHYETIEKMREAVRKVIDTLSKKDFHGAFQKLLERYKCIARRLLRRGLEFHECTIKKSAHTKKSGNLSYVPPIYIYIYIYIYIIECQSQFLSTYFY